MFESFPKLSTDIYNHLISLSVDMIAVLVLVFWVAVFCCVVFSIFYCIVKTAKLAYKKVVRIGRDMS